MNLSSKQLNTRDVECTAIKVNNVGNVLHLLQKTLTIHAYNLLLDRRTGIEQANLF